MATDGYSGDAIAALLFMQSSATTMDVYSALNSSPWTAESFGADERRSNALKEYVTHAVVYSMGYAIVAGVLAQQKYAWFIILSAAGTNVYLIWLYMRAVRRGREAGSDGWANT
jgi:predicted permease